MRETWVSMLHFEIVQVRGQVKLSHENVIDSAWIRRINQFIRVIRLARFLLELEAFHLWRDEIITQVRQCSTQNRASPLPNHWARGQFRSASQSMVERLRSTWI